ncbi:MAG: TRAP transporter large permease subunit, partial [Polaromonas sp.]|nr:TRAP transporter large permease subunit [Polaromonas sp.]
MNWLIDHLAVVMFFALLFIMFLGFPVAFLLGAIGVIFGILGMAFDVFNMGQFANLLPRVYGAVIQNQVLVAIPMFIFMGTMLEKSGVAEDLLHMLQLMLRGVPGGLAIAVTVLGTVLAATTGIVGASVVMLTLIALPVMLARGYDKSLSVGTIASAGTLGILIPPSIMLVIMGDLMGVSVGTLFTGAFLPGLVLSVLYIVLIAVACYFWPNLAPRMQSVADGGEVLTVRMVIRSFVPAASLIGLVLGSIFFGWATPTEASGVGALGAIVLAAAKKRLNMAVLREVMTNSALTNAMVFFIFFGATLFSYVFRALGGDDVVLDILKATGIVTGWEVLTFVMILVFIMGFF